MDPLDRGVEVAAVEGVVTPPQRSISSSSGLAYTRGGQLDRNVEFAPVKRIVVAAQPSIIWSSESAMAGSIVARGGSRNAETHPAVRGPRRRRGEAGRLRRLGDAGASTTGFARSTSACGARCGVFDVSHMGEIETEGPQAAELLQRLLSNDVSKIQVGGAQYSCLCREDGGVLDDLFTYRLGDDRYLTVTNAANHERDLEWFEAHAVEFEAEVRDRIDAFAMLAVQGPEARQIVQRAHRRRAAGALQDGRAARGRIARPWSAAPATRARTAWSC